MSKPATKTPEVAVQSLRADVRGIATVEYVTLLVLVTLGGAAAVLALGVPFVKMFRFQQLLIALPFP